MPSRDIAVSVRNVTKSYRIFGHPGDRLKQALTFGFRHYHQDFTSLHDISFEIAKGETLGIVGRNGSGKTTLLQLICGILKPTKGTVIVNGRIAALLELGAGFNPEFTGRENIYFQGALMGLRTPEMDARLDKICSFAGIGSFIDQPVRIYSSGMFVRLAFSVAIHVSPDILIIDEALAVGDEAFQRKCFSHIRQFAEAGGTLVLVSHSTPWIIDLCSRAIQLHDGRLACAGTAKHVVDRYHRTLLSPGSSGTPPKIHSLTRHEPLIASSNWDTTLIPSSTLSYPSLGATIQSVSLLDNEDQPVNILVPGRTYRLRYFVAFHTSPLTVRFGMLVKTTTGVELGGAASDRGDSALTHIQPGMTATVEFELRCLLTTGTYFLNCGVWGIVEDEERYLHRIVDALMFRVRGEQDDGHTGIVRLCDHLSTSVVATAITETNR